MQTGAVSGSILSVIRTTFQQSGFGGLYRGVSAPLLAVTPIFALSFWGYDMGQQIVRNVRDYTPTTSLTLPDIIAAGGLSGFPPTLLMGPSERIKVLLQTAPPGRYAGMMDCAWHVLQTGGLSSLFRGTALTLARDVPGSMAWFGTYEVVKRSLAHSVYDCPVPSLPAPAVLAAGGCAGMATWVVSIPADVVKSRVQSGNGESAAAAARALYREGGVGAFFRGIRPALVRAFPANAACFWGMETARKGLDWADERIYEQYYVSN